MDADTLILLGVWGLLLMAGLWVVRLRGPERLEMDAGQTALDAARHCQEELREARHQYHALDRDFTRLARWAARAYARLAMMDTTWLEPPPDRHMNGDTPTEQISDRDFARLRLTLTERLTLEEARNMASDLLDELEVDPEGATTTGALVRWLLDTARKRHKIGLILGWVARNRPDIQL